MIKEKSAGVIGNLSERSVYLIATFLAGVYVLSQEVKWHNLGGNNVYDPYDVVASLIGLVVINRIFSHFGFLDKASSSV